MLYLPALALPLLAAGWGFDFTTSDETGGTEGDDHLTGGGGPDILNGGEAGCMTAGDGSISRLIVAWWHMWRARRGSVRMQSS